MFESAAQIVQRVGGYFATPAILYFSNNFFRLERGSGLSDDFVCDGFQGASFGHGVFNREGALRCRLDPLMEALQSYDLPPRHEVALYESGKA